MSKIIDHQKIDDNIFLELKNNNETKYNNFFGAVPPEHLFYLFVNLCGDKRVTKIVEMVDNNQLYNIIINKFGENWLKIKTAISKEYSAFEPFNMTESNNEDITANETSASNNKNSSAVYAFNSGDIVDSDETLTEKDNTTDTTHNRTKDKNKSGNDGKKTNAELLKEELKIRKDHYYNFVLNDVMNLLTLDVY